MFKTSILIFAIMMTALSYGKVVIPTVKPAESKISDCTIIDYKDKTKSPDIRKYEIIEYAEEITKIVNSVKSVDTSKMSSVEIAHLMEATYKDILSIITKAMSSANYEKMIDIMTKSVNSVNEKDAIKFKKWYEMKQLAPGGTGLWAVVTKAKKKAERGEDITELYNVFLKMLSEM